MGVQTKMEVTTIEYGMGCIATSQHVGNNIHGTIFFLLSLDDDTAQHSLQVVVLLQVGLQVYLSTGSCSHRHLGESHEVKVHIPDISYYCCFQILAVGQRIQAHQSLEQLIIAVDICMYFTICYMGNSQQVVDMILAIMQLCHLCLGVESSMVGQEISAHALGFHRSCKRVKLLMRQEMTHLYLMGLHLGTIGQVVHVETSVFLCMSNNRCFYIHSSTTFPQGHLGGILRAVHCDISLQDHAIRDTHILH